MVGKRDLVEAVYGSVEGITKRQAAALVEAILEAIREILARGERVTIPGFGSLSVERRAPRRGRNPATGAAILIPAARTARFRAGKGLSEALAPPERARPASRKQRTSLRRAPREGRSLSGASPGGSGPPPPDADRGLPVDAPKQSTYHSVKVFYATDRKPTGSARPALRYGAGRGDGSLEYGVCEVSIPEDHHLLGRLEGPSWRRLQFRPDPEKHVVLLALEALPADGFFDKLSATLRAAPRSQLLLFLHGFNVTFEDAARRTAQMAYDLALEGAPAFYSWPSRGKLSPTGYTHDENNVEWTIPHLKGFLEELAARSGAEAIHLIAHSMGNRALTRALEQLAAVMAEPDAPRFSEVILTAPDIDAGVFRQIAAAFRRASRRVTLYVSQRDRALQASHRIHGYPRAGDGGPNVVVLPGIDTIDASTVDTDLVGHFYYGDNRSVLSDVYYLLRHGIPPDGRATLDTRQSPAGPYWVFKR